MPRVRRYYFEFRRETRRNRRVQRVHYYGRVVGGRSRFYRYRVENGAGGVEGYGENSRPRCGYTSSSVVTVFAADRLLLSRVAESRSYVVVRVIVEKRSKYNTSTDRPAGYISSYGTRRNRSNTFLNTGAPSFPPGNDQCTGAFLTRREHTEGLRRSVLVSTLLSPDDNALRVRCD